MSLENAILAHAAALTALAEAIRSATGSMRALTLAGTPLEDAGKENPSAREAINEAIAAAKARTPKGGKAEEKGEASTGPESSGGAGAAGDAAEAEAETARNKAEVDKQNEPANLDYNKDVKPVLLAAIKRVGKEKVAEAIKTFGVDKADKVDPSDYAALVDAANALEK